MATSVVETEAAATAPPMNLEARLRRAFHRASGMPPDKELNESFAFFKKIDRDLKRQRPWPLIVDCCGGHGMLACLALAYGKALDAVVIDSHRPNSHDALVRAWSTGDDARAPRYIEQPLQTALPEVLAEGRPTLVLACHACAHLTEQIVAICAAAKADFCVMPCCQRPPTSVKTAMHELKIPSTVAMDLVMIGRCQQLGYEVHLKLVDEKITPQNRLICGRWTGESGGSTSFLPHEARLQKTYDRVHGRKRAAPPPLAKARRRRLPWVVLALAALPVLWRVRLRLSR